MLQSLRQLHDSRTCVVFAESEISARSGEYGGCSREILVIPYQLLPALQRNLRPAVVLIEYDTLLSGQFRTLFIECWHQSV